MTAHDCALNTKDTITVNEQEHSNIIHPDGDELPVDTNSQAGVQAMKGVTMAWATKAWIFTYVMI